MLSEKDAYKLRAMNAELQLLEVELQTRRKTLETYVLSLGYDPTKYAFVLHEGGQYPVGTVIDKATEKPIDASKEPAVESGAARQKRK